MDEDRVLDSPTIRKLRELNRVLGQAGIPFGFGGAVALGYAVREPRATHDLDLNISLEPSKFEAVLEVLPDGVMAPAGVEGMIRREGQVRLKWDDVPVDLFFIQHRFHLAVAERTAAKPFLDIVIPVISPTDLAVFKTLFNRPKDWPDIEAMLEAGSVDVDEALHWIAEIVGDDSDLYARFTETVERVRRSPARNPDDGDPNPWKSLRKP